jgi:glyoxylase-like metal-dependent hydrolase (beta-lactamase superfamily II)
MAKGRFEKVSNGVYIVGRGGWGGAEALSGPGDCNIYLIDGGSEAALIDAGCEVENPAVIDNVRATGVDESKVKKVLLTHAHWDHTAGAAWLSETLGAEIWAGTTTTHALAEGDNPLIGGSMPFQPRLKIAVDVDKQIADREKFSIGDIEFTALATPGHVLDAMCYVGEINGKIVMFSGDTAIGNQRRRDMGPDVVMEGMLGWLDRHWSTPVSTYVKTLDGLAAIDIDVLLPGHGIPNDGETAKAAIARARANLERLMADRDIFMLVALER